MDPNSLPLVKLIGTGGTIASWGATRLTYVDYSATGQRIDASELVARVPEVSEFARVECEQFAQLGSTSMGQIEWLKLGKRINQVLAEEPEVAGVVVAHGTSTMEETAYFLNLTVKSDRPVVLTGSMRPPSAMGTDADTNLMDAVRVAASPSARGMGALTVLNNEIQAARDVTKQNTFRLETFGARELGILGYADSDHRIVFYMAPVRRHTFQTEFDINGFEELPKVDVVYAVSGGDGLLVRALVQAGVPGIVAAGAGGGSGGPDWMDALAEARQSGAMVVMASHVGAGRVLLTQRNRERGILAGDNLSPQKARILLMLALTVTRDEDRIQQMFDAY